MTELWRICGFAVIGCVAVLLLRGGEGEYALGVRVAVGVAVMGTVLMMAEPIVSEWLGQAEAYGVSPYASVMLRALGISLLSHTCAEVCRDCGEAGLAGGVETGGRVAILLLCLPLINEILSLASSLMEME